MAQLLVFLMITLVCIIINAQGQQTVYNNKLVLGQAFDEIVVSSDLNVKRKSKENRRGKGILENVPSGTIGPPGKYTPGTPLRFISRDRSKITTETRHKRQTTINKSIDLGVAGYLLKSRKR